MVTGNGNACSPCSSPHLKQHLTNPRSSVTGARVVAWSPAARMDAADASPLEVSPRAGSWRRSRPWSRSSSIGHSGSISSGGGSGSGSIEYTSLRDVLEEDSSGNSEQQQNQPWSIGGWGEYSCHDIHDFDASNIGIRNQLLKHAASAYLQSAVVVAAEGRDDGDWDCCLARLWRRCGGGGGGGGGGVGGRRGRGGRGRVLMRACSWKGCVDEPAEFVARAARRLAAFVAGRVNAVWAW